MSRKLAGLISVLGAAGSAMSGYARGKQQYDAGERAKKLEGREDAEYEYQLGKRAKADRIEQGIAGAQGDIDIEEVADPDHYNPASMGGVGTPEGVAPPAPVGYKVAGQTFADRGAAEQARLGINSRAAKDKRTADYLRSEGQIDAARRYDEFYKQAINEGTDKILGAITAARPPVDAVKKAGGMVAGTIGAEAAEVFNGIGGNWKVTPETMVQHFIDKDAAGREFVNSRVMGKDGKPVVEDVNTATLMLADFKTRIEQKNKDTTVYQDGQRIAETVRHNGAVEAETAANNKALRANQAATLDMARRREKREIDSFKALTPEGRIAEIEKITGPLSPADKKTIGLSMLGVKGKGSTDADSIIEKKIEERVKTWHDANPDATPEQIAMQEQSLRDAYGTVKTNAGVESVVREELGKHKPGTDGYATSYAEALAVPGMTAAALATMGYAKPPTPKPTPKAAAAAPAGKAAAPAVVADPWKKPRSPHAEYLAKGRSEEAAKLQGTIAELEKHLSSSKATPALKNSLNSRLAAAQRQLAELQSQQ